MNATLSDLLKKMLELSGSDLHISTNSPPQVRVHGHLQPLDMPMLNPSETKQLAYSVLTDAQKHRFEEHLELDFSFGLKGLARFRGNVFNQRGATGAVFRVIPFEIKSFQQLNLPPIVSKLCEKPRGLILVTGPTGSGKSTTLAAMIDKINTERHDHIITIEDPIEFVHQNKNCLVNQREVHADTKSFSDALRAALREDPDVVLIGEMRDLETIESALRIAETGHLWHLAHEFGCFHDQPCDRRLPIAPAVADSRAIIAGVGRCALSVAAVEDRRTGTRVRHGDPGAERRSSQSDQRRQNSPDLFRDAIRSGQIRDADFQSVAGEPVFQQTDFAGNGVAPLFDAG
jgi:Tfp pilus assembly ATPase PilU